ncbi:MAG: crossover junction endodeoxyribonuclease RuvC [Microbacteriaceae bacterium]|nr:ruvC [Microbacteriaceae bacterium]MDQ1526419.1 crossover junction endodeoxyribonuclease RuvC [Microbacteriaceae bacterium]MDQ1578967.1 crossover junction endodeoxyribonuclease RuvC [Microbacteriaceae bacterium]
MTTRVLGIDPGLTRCGVGIVDVTATRTATLVTVEVIRTPPDMPLEQRLLAVGIAIERLLDEHRPDSVAIERVFAQHNLRTVMGTAQVSGVALHAAAKRGLSVGLHTPSEVKASITGYGAADKKQVATMVARVLGLAELPSPADASDALAIAICHAWRTPTGAVIRSNSTTAGSPATGALTPAQQAWLAAERSTTKSVPKRRLAP